MCDVGFLKSSLKLNHRNSGEEDEGSGDKCDVVNSSRGQDPPCIPKPASHQGGHTGKPQKS